MLMNLSQVVGMLLMSDVKGEDPVIVRFDPALWYAIRNYAWTYDTGSGDVIGRRINPEGNYERVHIRDLFNIPSGWQYEFISEDLFDYRMSNLILIPC